MESKYKWDIFGIAKSIVLVACVLFVFIKWGDIKNIFNHQEPKPPQITKIDCFLSKDGNSNSGIGKITQRK